MATIVPDAEGFRAAADAGARGEQRAIGTRVSMAVREAVLTVLAEQDTDAVVSGLLPYLASDDATLPAACASTGPRPCARRGRSS